jgi:hypothetical protein
MLRLIAQKLTNSENPDMKFFNDTLKISLIIMVLVIILAAVVWRDGSKIMFIAPRTIELIDDFECLPTASEIIEANNSELEIQRCYVITDTLPAGYHGVSLVRLTGIILLIVTFFTLFINYGRRSKYDAVKDISKVSSRLVIRNFLVSLALTSFLFVVFTAFEVMGGLAAIDNTPTEVPLGIALLTTGAFISVASFRLINWISEWDFVDISSASVVILIVSYTLSILFTTNDWSHAYSQLGHTNKATEIAGFNGSQGLFLLTMASLGLIFLVFTLDTFVLLKNLMLKEHSIVKPKWLLWIMALSGFFAGLGAVIVGVIPANESNFHNVGAIGSPVSSVIMILSLAFLYPVATDSEYENRKPELWFITSIVVVSLVLIFGFFVVIKGDIVSALEAELVYFIMFLLYIQLYAQNLAEYIDEVEGLQAQDIS